MQRVKERIHYWCEDTASGRCLGSKITVAVLDSGIAFHPDFEGRILSFQDMTAGRVGAYDDCGHGTHVCGIIGGDGRMSEGKLCGIAPGCRFIVLKVLDRRGHGTVDAVIRGIRWILRFKDIYQIRIVNISVGSQPGSDKRSQKRLLEAVETLWDAGIVVVAAAGNYGPHCGTVTAPGCCKKIITVGASDDESGAEIHGKLCCNYSGRGPTEECVLKPELVAPGANICSCNAGFRKWGAQPYIEKSGTSMATPIVSGAAALLLSKYPQMTNVEIKLKFRESCKDLGLPGNQQGWGLVQIKELLQ